MVTKDFELEIYIFAKPNRDNSFLTTTSPVSTQQMCLVATSANTNRIQAHLFRNYNLPYRVTGHYQGSSLPKLWEAVRASAAAPGYFSEYRVGDLILLVSLRLNVESRVDLKAFIYLTVFIIQGSEIQKACFQTLIKIEV